MSKHQRAGNESCRSESKLEIYVVSATKYRRRYAMGSSPCAELLCIFRERFGDQIQFAQRANEFGIRLFSGKASSVDGSVVAVWRPNDGFSDVVIFAVAL